MLAGAQPAVTDILQSANLLRLFRIVPDRNAALTELRREHRTGGTD